MTPLHWPAFREWLDAETEDAPHDTPLHVVLKSFRQFCERTGRQQPTNRTELLALLAHAGIPTESYRAEGRSGVLWRALSLRVTSAPPRGRHGR